MFERIRVRLTAAYVAILALILCVFGIVAVLVFRDQAYDRQDDLLLQHARTKAESLLAGREADFLPTPGEPYAAWGVVGPDGQIADRSAGEVGLLSVPEALRSVRTGDASLATVSGHEGALRVASRPVTRAGSVIAVVQTGQLRREVEADVTRLAFVLVPTGIGALALAAVGGSWIARRAMRPVRDAFDRQRTFIADASHELKTPLTLIRADAEVLSRALSRRDEAELVEDLISETDRMAAVLSDLLLLARLDAGSVSVARRPFDISVVLTATSERFAALAAATGRTIDIRTDGHPTARGDPETTERILAAVLDNALRVTPQGGTVTMTAQTAGAWVEASVIDTGPGIGTAHLPHIFERFYRAEAARTRQHGGTGLGLAIARDLARAQSGDLTGDKPPHGGARFTLKLPAGR
ncbi:MAG: sensor histidine kinase [Acidimicrobiales bacterium]